jgi:hypothetical protein
MRTFIAEPIVKKFGEIASNEEGIDDRAEWPIHENVPCPTFAGRIFYPEFSPSGWSGSGSLKT